MALLDVAWLFSTVVLSIISWRRFRANLQPIGALAVACAMATAAIFICVGAEIAAQVVQVAGIVVAISMILLNERWKARLKAPKGRQ